MPFLKLKEKRGRVQLPGSFTPHTTIDLYGILGSFRILNSPFDIKYVSTFARAAGTDGHAALLRELKPMRERVDALAMSDLSSLLQRDLSDQRVANDLVPYLLGQKNSGIGFFPSILAVMVPTGYLDPGSGAAYPRPKTSALAGNDIAWTEFGNCWKTSTYQIGEQNSPLGMVKIATDCTQIIVLDGQHRANAFRYLSGAFDPTNSIYQTFYDGSAKPQQLEAQLPVTLIWFEAAPEKSIDPKIISRQLFVDVNNSPETVSASRTILLDDRTVTALGTQAFYNESAKSGFVPTRFSLLHGAFDMDADLVRSRVHAMTLTTPEIVDSALSWGLFGSPSYDGLGIWNATRLGIQRNHSRFAHIFPDYSGAVLAQDQDERAAPFFPLQKKSRDFRATFANDYLPLLNNLFKLDLLAPHYKACDELAQWRTMEADTTKAEVWDKVFCGGEGLYWVFDAATKAGNKSARGYREAIDDIENLFRDKRCALFGLDRRSVDALYESFCTKAFQSGYVGAIEYIAGQETGDYLLASDQLVARMNAHTLPQWSAIFNRLRPLVINGTDPKKWPSYRNILLRVYDADTHNIYSISNWKQSPDYVAYIERVKKLGQGLVNAGLTPDDAEQKRLLGDEFDKVKKILSECGLDATWFDKTTVVASGLEILKEILDLP